MRRIRWIAEPSDSQPSTPPTGHGQVHEPPRGDRVWRILLWVGAVIAASAVVLTPLIATLSNNGSDDQFAQGLQAMFIGELGIFVFVIGVLIVLGSLLGRTIAHAVQSRRWGVVVLALLPLVLGLGMLLGHTDFGGSTPGRSPVTTVVEGHSGDQNGGDCLRAQQGDTNLTSGALSGCNLTGANLRGANLANAYLDGANLTVAVLAGANLATANLKGADLTRADLNGSNLKAANLANANLTGANLTRTTLTGAELGEPT